VSEVTAATTGKHVSGTELRRRLRWLIFHAWNIPPVFGLGFIVLFGVLYPSQVLVVITTPLEPIYILFCLLFAIWYLPRQMQPLADWLDHKPGVSAEDAQQAVRRFPLIFWSTFLIYLGLAPASVIISAEFYTDFTSTPYDWFRIQLIAVMVSIIVGLPIFFLIFDLFGRALGDSRLVRPILTIRTKVFLVGALVPLLIDTMLVQYYWTRTGYFSLETFGVWILLEILAIVGSLVFAYSFGQSLGPLQALAGVSLPLPEADIAALRARSTDEVGIITADYRNLLEKQRQQGEILEENNSLLRIAATAFESQIGMLVTDTYGVILRVNKAYTQITGETAEEVVGREPRLFRSNVYNSEFQLSMKETIERTGRWRGEIWGQRKNGLKYPVWLTVSAVKDENGEITQYVGTIQDITERKKQEERINELAFFDQLTGLPNRRLLFDRIKQGITSSSRNKKYGALLLIDLDNFKTTNDTLGHDIGDLLLQQVAQRVEASVREGDTVARLGGDEFVVMLHNLSSNYESAANETITVGNKILASLNRTYELSSYVQHSTSSIGATLFSEHQGSLEELLKQADLAMYQAKCSGHNRMLFFDPVMQVSVIKRAEMEADLRQAILEKQFLLHYQAQVDDKERLLGVEALLRWQHPERGLVPPLEFIPLSEDTGLILQIGRWVLETACMQLALWENRPELNHVSIAVNVSAHQLHHPDFVDTVLAILEKSGANPHRLKLELTESVLVNDMEGAITKMAALKKAGVSFSLDDFGTGYSSLSYLKKMPLDQLKIDQIFIRTILSDENDTAIVKTVTVLAKSFNLSLIAEGVETRAQKDYLANLGCHTYQGYLFGRPLPVDEFEKSISIGEEELLSTT